MKRHVSRLVHCSNRRERSAMLEIMVTHGEARIVSVDKMPPGYDHLLRRFDQQDGETVIIPTDFIREIENDFACPNCGNTGILICSNCGAYHCYNKTGLVHDCPKCGHISKRDELFRAPEITTSVYGTAGEGGKRIEGARSALAALGKPQITSRGGKARPSLEDIAGAVRALPKR